MSSEVPKLIAKIQVIFFFNLGKTFKITYENNYI